MQLQYPGMQPGMQAMQAMQGYQGMQARAEMVNGMGGGVGGGRGGMVRGSMRAGPGGVGVRGPMGSGMPMPMPMPMSMGPGGMGGMGGMPMPMPMPMGGGAMSGGGMPVILMGGGMAARMPMGGAGGGMAGHGGEAPTRAVVVPSLPAGVRCEEICDAVGSFGPIESIALTEDMAHVSFVDVGAAYQLMMSSGGQIMLQVAAAPMR